MIYLLCLFLILILTQTEDILYNHTNSEDNLYFVFTTFRHGARYPFVKTDFFGNNIKAPGALTKYGGIQHLEIGKKYRERYSNFLNMNFDETQFYISSSDEEKSIASTEKQLEGLFDKKIDRNYFHIIKDGENALNFLNLNEEKYKKLNEYLNFCKKSEKKEKTELAFYYNQTFNIEIFPILKKYFGTQNNPDLNKFCDSVFSCYFEYIYGNDTNNKIGICGKENVKKIYNFCYNRFNSFRGCDEYDAYMLYTLYKHLFNYMNNAIKGLSPVKMITFGGNDITVGKFMDFLDRLKIIQRTIYPHYAFNIVIELRKYNNDFYLEFYYNDILKYNNTLKSFQNILNNSKYINIYNYCNNAYRNLENKVNEINNSTNSSLVVLKSKLKKIFKQDDDFNLFIFLGCILFIVIILIIVGITICIYIKRKRKYIKLFEEKNKSFNQISSVMSVPNVKKSKFK